MKQLQHSGSISLREDVARLERVDVSGEMSRYSALKSDTPIMETARSVSIEDRQQLMDKGAINLADTYLYTAGVFGEAYGFATRGDWVQARTDAGRTGWLPEQVVEILRFESP